MTERAVDFPRRGPSCAARKHRWVRMVLISLTGLPACTQLEFSRSARMAGNLESEAIPGHPQIRIGIQVPGDVAVLESAGRDRLATIGSDEQDPGGALDQVLSARLGRPVQVAALGLPQIDAQLQDGRLQFVLMGEKAAKELARRGTVGAILAVAEPFPKRGLIVAAARSTIHGFEDLVGERFAFGPVGDPVLDRAAVAALEKAGVSVDSLKREMLPVPGGRQFHATSRETAKAIVYEFGTYAGVIDELDYLAMSETGGRFLPGVFTFSKDQFRVLGRTELAVANSSDHLRLVAAHDVDAKLIDDVMSFLLAADETDPMILTAMGVVRFAPAQKHTGGDAGATSAQ